MTQYWMIIEANALIFNGGIEDKEKIENQEEGGLGRLILATLSPLIIAGMCILSSQIDNPRLVSKKLFLNCEGLKNNLYFDVYMMNSKDNEKYQQALKEIGIKDKETTPEAYEKLQKYFKDNKENYHISHFWGL